MMDKYFMSITTPSQAILQSNAINKKNMLQTTVVMEQPLPAMPSRMLSNDSDFIPSFFQLVCLMLSIIIIILILGCVFGC